MTRHRDCVFSPLWRPIGVRDRRSLGEKRDAFSRFVPRLSEDGRPMQAWLKKRPPGSLFRPGFSERRHPIQMMRSSPRPLMLWAPDRETRFNPTDRRRTTLLLTASYTFADVLWDILIVFTWVLFIWVAVVCFIDIFRRRDLSGWAKAAWVILIVILPWIGVLIYLIVNHDGMAERSQKESQASQAQFDEYVRRTAGGGSSTASEIEKAKQLLDSGTITQAEFDALKAKALS
jgi:hypothetical protein